MPTLPNLNPVTLPSISDIKNKAVTTLSNTQIVRGLQQGITNLPNPTSGLLNNLTNAGSSLTKLIPGMDLDFDVNPPSFVPPINANIDNAKEKQKKSLPKDFKFPLINPLHQYASYNYIWTMSILKPFDYNFPDLTYKKGKYNSIIFRSGTGLPEDRIKLTNYISEANPEGKYDFFMDNVRISGLIGMDRMTGTSNATGINFTIVEPYSIGMFFQAIATAAKIEGYKTWIECPILLTLEFFGHMDFDNQNVFGDEHTTRHFPIKISQIEMAVGTEGSKYECTAIPWNEQAFSKELGSIKSNMEIVGSNIIEMLQKGPKSLQTFYNEHLKNEAKKQNPNIIPDQIVILFPVNADSAKGNNTDKDSSSPPSATQSANESTSNADILKKLNVEKAADGQNLIQNQNINSLGLAPLGFSAAKKDRETFGADGEVWDPEKQVYTRGSVTVKANEGIANFKQGTDIPQIIEQVILGSDYGRQALDPGNIDENGKISWYRIDTQMYLIPNETNLQVTNRYPVIRVYRVLPHKVHHSRFMDPKDKPSGVKALLEKSIKTYEYIYTGKNLDIIDFKINFDNSFYQALNSDSGKSNIDVKTRNKNNDVSTDLPKNKGSDQTSVAQPVSEDSSTGPGIPNYTSSTSMQSGIGQNDPSTIIAKQFQKALTKGTDMINLEIKVAGDPFYLGDSGMGNYTAQDTEEDSIMENMAINYQRGEVYITIKFRNPVDINHKTGLYDFGGAVVPEFSGLYRVLDVQSLFDKGLFTQTLNMVRMPNFELDEKGEVTEAAKPALLNQEQIGTYDRGTGTTEFTDVI